MKKYQIDIIGGAGFVGFSLAMHLSSSFDVKTLDVKEPIKKMDSLVFESCDIRKYEEVVKALADCDLVFTLLSFKFPKLTKTNVWRMKLIFWARLKFVELLKSVQE